MQRDYRAARSMTTGRNSASTVASQAHTAGPTMPRGAARRGDADLNHPTRPCSARTRRGGGKLVVGRRLVRDFDRRAQQSTLHRQGVDCAVAWQERKMKPPRVVSDPEILGGTPDFVGTRVPVRILFEHLEAGDSLEIFLEDFPTVSRELAVQVLEDAKRALELDAHPA